ncbi:hypothetical protein [Priestia megaterium]|uniref:hypothetical protein n=1 Tax=Priestia megaterium TaxID=1404 RepID=UPI0015E3A19E|nr:hypothetical protein [Priestia megaterium]
MRDWLFSKWQRFLDKIGIENPWEQMATTWIVVALFLILTIAGTIFITYNLLK